MTVTSVAFDGIRGSGSFATDQRPKAWREKILQWFPNGSLPLTALTSRIKSEQVSDAEFNWWTKIMPTQRATVTGVYTDAGLASAYTSGAVLGATLYVKMSAADCAFFRAGHEVLLRDASDFTVDVVGKVTSTLKNGASSYICVKLLEADDNSTHSHDLSDCDTALVIGNINSENATVPSSIAYDPLKFTNYTQIFRTPLQMSRTANNTSLRTGKSYPETKKDTLRDHGVEMERAFLFGIPTENVGSNGLPERTTQGLVNFIRTNIAANCDDYSYNSTYSGKSWLEGGEIWLDNMLEQVFRYGSKERFAFCGSGTILGINQLVKTLGTYEINSATGSYGINVTRWVTPFGVINLYTHPLFSMEPTNRYSMILFEFDGIVFRYITDTKFMAQSNKDYDAGTRTDGLLEEYLTEAGLEFHNPLGWAYLNGVGVDSVV